MKKLNLGCGEYKKKGYINLDANKSFNPDIIHDLNKFPYPFDDNYFDIIEMDHVLEHLNDPFIIMKEIHRIIKHNGVLTIKIPHFSRGFTHADHKRGFDVSFPYYFNPNAKLSGYSGVDFEIKSISLKWFAQPYIKKIFLSKHQYILGRLFGFLIDFFANLSPVICSRIWCYLVGGFDEIKFILIKK